LSSFFLYIQPDGQRPKQEGRSVTGWSDVFFTGIESYTARKGKKHGTGKTET
jgi:hypothetical protein